MALDFSILTRQPSFAESYMAGQREARAEQEQNLLRRAQLQQMAAQQENILAQRAEREAQTAARQQASAAQNELAKFASSGQPMTTEALARFGAPGLALAKTLREEQTAKIDQELKTLDYISRNLAAATPETYGAIRADIGRINPQFASALPQEFNPDQVMALARRGMSLKDQIESATKETVAPAGASIFRGGRLIATAPAAERPYEPTEVEKLTNALRAAPPGSVEAQALQNRLRILTTREPKEPREPSAPVAVVDEATGKVKYVSREEAMGKTPAAAMEGLSPKEIQKREAALPQATSAIKGFETKSDAFIRDLKALRDDPGLENITGPIFGRTGSVTPAGSRAQALYDKVVAKGGFQALQDLRDASKTGGALGNVSNQEGKQLTASFAAIDRRQSAADVRAAIDQAIADIEGSKTRMREAYDSTYSYKQGGAAPSAAAAPAAAPTTAPMYATNPKTKERIMSTDGGNTWTPAR